MKTHKTPNKSHQTPILNLELIPISFETIKREWISSFREIERKLEKAKREWNAFDSEARGAFQTWYYSTFSKDLSALREIEEASEHLKRTLDAIGVQMRVNSLSKREAYLKVKARTIDNHDPFPSEDELLAFKEKQSKKFQEKLLDRLSQNGKHEVDPERLDDIGIEDEAYDFNDEPLQHQESAKIDSSNYKTVYRQIVRLLHPDRGLEMNEIEKGLWAQAQEAYRSQNEASLRLVLLRIEGGGRMDVSQLQSIGAIRELTISLHDEYDEMNFVKSREKKDPVYCFWASRKRPGNRIELEAQIRSKLKTSIHYRSNELRALQAEIKKIERNFGCSIASPRTT